MVPISSLAAPDRMTVTSTGTACVPRVVAGDASVNAASFGFRVRCGAPLRFLRSGGGTELLEMLLDLGSLGGSLAGGPDEKGALYRRLNFDESSDAAEPRSYKVLGPIITTPLAGGR